MAANKQQQAIIDAPAGKLLVIAAAGSGKTKTVIDKIIHEIKVRKLPPESIVAMTFTRKAAREMKERLAKELGEDIAKRVSMGTIHSWCSKNVIRPNTKYFGFTSDSVRVVTGYEDLLKQLDETEDLDAKQLSAIAQRFSQNIGRGIEFEDDDRILFRKMRAYQFKANVITCDDIIHFSFRRLEDDPAFRKSLASKYRLVIIDESQDNAPLQNYIAMHLASVHNNIMVVGDDGQCQPFDTMVRMADLTEKPIDEVKNGDLILSYDSRVHQMCTEIVLETAYNDFNGDLVVIDCGDRQIRCTPNHKCTVKDPITEVIYLSPASELDPDEQLIPVVDCQWADELPFANKECDIQWVTFSISKEPHNGRVYSLSVSGMETYVADGIITHNSIYGWRQADPKQFVGLRDKGFTVYKLETNYRSHQKILDLANEVLRYNQGVQIEKEITAAFPNPLAPRPRLMVFCNRSKPDESSWLSGNIARLINMEGVKPSEIAILCRSVNGGTGRRLQAQLLSKGVKYTVVGGADLANNNGVRRLFSAFGLAAGTSHVEDWRELVELLEGIGAKSARTILDNAPDPQAMLAAIPQTKAVARQQFSALLKTLAEMKSCRRDAGYCVSIFANWYLPIIDGDHEALAKANKYFDIIAVASSKVELLESIENFTLEADDETEKDPNRVTISTVHRAKGLEYAHVFVPDCHDKMIPHVRSRSAGEIQEECRVLYVAITRAKKDLCLTATIMNNEYDPDKDCPLSRFLTTEIEEDYLDTKYV